jgi:YYY domain-containing protein
MSETLRFWLVLQVVALPLLPLCLAMFRNLPDRGYALSKPFALILLAFTFWFLNSLRVLPNSTVGILVALAPLAAIGVWFAWRDADALRGWLLAHWRYIAGVEVLLFLSFALAVYLRTFVGSISGTEQPMDLMFLNAVTHAERFPPKDPWLSNFTVAYYYFGYLIVAIVGKLAAVPTYVGYNVGLGMIASLTLVGGFGLVYNLVVMHVRSGAVSAALLESAPAEQLAREERLPRKAVATARSELGAARVSRPSLGEIEWKPLVFGLLGAASLVLLGNLVFLFTFASAYGIGGDGFYSWLDIARSPGDPNSGLRANEQRDSWYPSQFFEFFQSSRVYPINDDGFRVITEFPMFSLLLGDLHPHVMALPFVLLVVAAALTLYRSDEPLDITFWLQRPLLLLATAIMLGALAFINTWDIATFSFVLIGAAALSNYGRVRRLTGDLALQIVSFAAPLLALAIVLYAPFYVSFTSQADGILPVVSRDGVTDAGTRPVHFIIFWGLMLVAVVPFVGMRIAAARERVTSRLLGTAAAVPAAIVAGWALLFVYHRVRSNPDLDGAGPLLTQLADRGSGWLTAIAIAVMLGAAVLALWLEVTADEQRDERRAPIFTLLLVTTSLLLIMGTEFFYVGDVFNVRMNTVFKLYYQAWLLLAIAAGFSLYSIAGRWPRNFAQEPSWRIAWGVAAAIVMGSAALYTTGGTFNRIRPFDGAGNPYPSYGSVDGLRHLAVAEREGIAYLRGIAEHQEFVIVEAVGNDYTLAGRISMATGIPTVLGWGGHEDQWRGSSEPRAGRFEDIEALYRANDLAPVEQISRKYGVSYIYVGELERSTYGEEALEKFRDLAVAFQSGPVTIYRAPGRSGVLEQR